MKLKSLLFGSAAVLAAGASDGSNEANDYADPTYSPVNEPLIVKLAGATMVDPNRWQPLLVFGSTGEGTVQRFVAPQWGLVKPFALTSGAQFRPPAVPLPGRLRAPPGALCETALS